MADQDKLYLDQYDDGNPDLGADDGDSLTEEQVEELQSLIGGVIFQFNALETSLDWIIAEAINDRSHQPGYAITAELSPVFTKKVLVFKALYGPLVQAMERKRLAIEFESLWKSLFKLKDIRNEVAHADWSNASKKYEVRLKITTDEGGPYALRKIMTPDFLTSKIEELENCIQQIERFAEQKDNALAGFPEEEHE